MNQSVIRPAVTASAVELDFAERLRNVIPQRGHRKKVLFVTPEYTGLIKAGGLGDVSAALPRALAHCSDVRILIPGYREILKQNLPIKTVARLEGLANIPACKVGELQLEKDGPTIYVLLCPELFDREGSPYGRDGKDWEDNHIRFARLGLAAADLALGKGHIGWRPDIIHANDWPSALAPAYMALRNQPTPSLFTIHNLAFQGLFDPAICADIGLPGEVFNTEEMEFFGKLSFMKAGLVYSNSITTVSETYAHEITRPEFGCGLHGLLEQKSRQGLLHGITNGIDDSWEPSSDPYLAASFSPRQWEAKRVNTRYVESRFNLAANDGPLFAVVSRLAEQKGVDLTLGIADKLVRAGGRLAVMGTGEPELERALMKLAKRYPRQVGVHIGFNEIEARRFFAGSDFLLMPSRFEPCGLSQMYAQRFGSLPIATCTGGLADTIQDGLNGFLFHETTLDSYDAAVKRALKVYERPELLNAMRCHAMNSPQYWRDSVRPYQQLYLRVLNARHPSRHHSIHALTGGLRQCR